MGSHEKKVRNPKIVSLKLWNPKAWVHSNNFDDSKFVKSEDKSGHNTNKSLLVLIDHWNTFSTHLGRITSFSLCSSGFDQNKRPAGQKSFYAIWIASSGKRTTEGCTKTAHHALSRVLTHSLHTELIHCTEIPSSHLAIKIPYPV